MKNITFFLIAVCTTISSVSQNYIPIPADSTAEWVVWNGLNDGMCIQNKDFKYFFDGDTVLGQFIYHKLFQSGFYHEYPVGPPGTGCASYYRFENIYVGAIRNDTGKVFLNKGYQDELIYDFTLLPGDTLDTYLAGNDLVIESIDSVMIGDEYRRRFNLFNPDGYSNWIIEGIGHEKGLIEPMYLPLEHASEFYCYAENHEPVYPEEATCDLAINIYEISFVNSLLNIYPNPSKGIITISFKGKYRNIINLKIFSPLGQIIVNSPWSIIQGLNESTIDISSVNSGIYVAVLQDGTNIIRKKFTLSK